MNRMEDAKKKYEEVPIPEELSKRIQWEVQKADSRRKKAAESSGRKRKGYLRGWQKGIVAAAAAMAVFVTALNTSTVFAQNVGELPVIGAIAKVLTFRSYEMETEDDLHISVDIPSIEMIAEGTGNLAESVNEEILEMCEQYADEAVERAKEYRQAFLDTGGTEEEWAAHDIQIHFHNLGYLLERQLLIKSQFDNLLHILIQPVDVRIKVFLRLLKAFFFVRLLFLRLFSSQNRSPPVPQDGKAFIYHNPVKPGSDGCPVFQLPVMLQCLAHRALHRVKSVLLILYIAEGQPVKFILIFNDIRHYLIIQILCHSSHLPSVFSALFSFIFLFVFLFYYIDGESF